MEWGHTGLNKERGHTAAMQVFLAAECPLLFIYWFREMFPCFYY